MKKNLLIIVLIVLLCTSVIIACYFGFQSKASITKDDALEIAYTYAGVNSSDVTVTKISKDYEDHEYEIEFYDSAYEYEIDVNYFNGTVNNFEKDAIKGNLINSNTTSPSMTEDEAKEIALALQNLSESDVTFTKITLSKEDGVTVYKVYFYDSEKQYEVYINVETEEIVKYEEEYISSPASTSSDTSTSSYIGVSKAKEIVLAHANVSENSVIWHEVKLDVEYGTSIYEIEFYYNNLKYDYEVNALTGSIISYEIDRY